MNREEYEDFYNSWCNSQMSGDAFALIANNYIFNLELKIKTLTYNNEAQEIIIRDKTAFMEAMAQPKTCEGCMHKDTDGFCSLVSRVYTFDKGDILLAYIEAVDGYSCCNYEPKAHL